jgi:hypothetical protein
MITIRGQPVHIISQNTRSLRTAARLVLLEPGVGTPGPEPGAGWLPGIPVEYH